MSNEDKISTVKQSKAILLEQGLYPIVIDQDLKVQLPHQIFNKHKLKPGDTVLVASASNNRKAIMVLPINFEIVEP